MKKCKAITKISFSRENSLCKNEINIEQEHGHSKSFWLSDHDMIQLEKTVNIYNKNFIENDNLSSHS